MLAVPLWIDQIGNAQKAIRMGIALALDKKNMEEPHIIEGAMRSLLENTT